MLKTTKKVLCYTAITGILNLSFQPAYAGKSDLPLNSEETSYTQKVSHHLSKKDLYKERVSDPSAEDPQTNSTRAVQAVEEDTIWWLFLTPLKTMIGAVSLVKQGVRFALENPSQVMTMGLILQGVSPASTLRLSSLTPNQGFTINGAAAGDKSGWSVSSIGDFNGDGLSDIIIGARDANNGAGNYAGKSYVIYGTISKPSLISLSSLTPLRGFTINGAATNDNSGQSVSSAGDFNGDGLKDVIIGAFGANSGAGKSYVIYGTNSTPSSINLASLTPQQGFTINGAATNDYSGGAVSSAGDFNGDGFDDVIIGAYNANRAAGKSYVIYGTNNSTLSSLSLSSLTAEQGFTISGTAADDQSGWSVSSAGDFNDDGLGDVIIGAPYANGAAGKSYVIYGTNNSTLSSLTLSSLTPLQGFTILGAVIAHFSGWSVSSAGDFNRDGLNDVIIGAPDANSYAGNSYVIYGTTSLLSSISLSSLTPTQGFILSGLAYDKSGYSVSSAGDFNGDGNMDIIIGAPKFVSNSAGKSFVVYGTNNTRSSISLSSLTPTQGFNISSTVIGDWSGVSVSSGDFNGDGLNDVIIGSPYANNSVGKSYVIYGVPAPSPASPSMMTSAPTNQTISPNSMPSSSLSMMVTPTPSSASLSMMTSTGTLTNITMPTSQMASTNSTPSSGITIANSTSGGARTDGSPSITPSFLSVTSNQASGGTGTNSGVLTSQLTSANPTSSPSTTSSQQPGGQDQAGEAPTQSLSKWLAGAVLLIGQERF